MDDANRVFADLECPRCGERERFEIRFRYGAAGHPSLAVGDLLTWPPGAPVLGGPSSEPLLEIAGIASCPACASLAARWARGEWKSLRRACDGGGGSLPRPASAGEERIDKILAFLDYGFSFREARELAGEVISTPGRWIERLGEWVLGYSPVQFHRFAALVRIERDRIAAVALLPLALQDVLQTYPVSLHFGLLSPALPTLRSLAEARGETWLAGQLVRLAIQLEVGDWWRTLRGEDDGRMDFVSKLSSLRRTFRWASAELSRLAELDRFSTVAEIESALAEIHAESVEDSRDEGDPLARLSSLTDP